MKTLALGMVIATIMVLSGSPAWAQPEETDQRSGRGEQVREEAQRLKQLKEENPEKFKEVIQEKKAKVPGCEKCVKRLKTSEVR